MLVQLIIAMWFRVEHFPPRIYADISTTLWETEAWKTNTLLLKTSLTTFL